MTAMTSAVSTVATAAGSRACLQNISRMILEPEDEVLAELMSKSILVAIVNVTSSAPCPP
jgi:hypothetical protein